MSKVRNGRRARQHGLSLVEVAVSMVIMGVAATMSWQAIRATWVRGGETQSRAFLQRAEASVLTFAALHGRLPCPATQADGLEVCGPAGNDQLRSGFFPYRTVGVPEPRLARLRYGLNVQALPVPPSGTPEPFMVLVNDQLIGPSGGPNYAPRATSVALSSVASSTHDNVLNLCAVLSRIARGRPGSVEQENGYQEPAFILEQASGDNLVLSSLAPAAHSRVTTASRVSVYLSCTPSTSVGGRGQYHAHLGSAVLNKTLKDYKWITEADYATYVWDLAEGMWGMSTQIYSQVLRWPKTFQALSQISLSRWRSGYRQQAAAIATQASSLGALGAQVSNVQRFRTNLQAVRERYAYVLDLNRRAVAVYERAWRNAVLSSSSAYFLNEQTDPPSHNPPLGGVTSIDPPNAAAVGALDEANSRAAFFGPGIGELASFPTQPLDSFDLTPNPGTWSEWE